MKGLIAWVSMPFFSIAKHKAPILGEVTVSCSLLTLSVVMCAFSFVLVLRSDYKNL